MNDRVIWPVSKIHVRGRLGVAVGFVHCPAGDCKAMPREGGMRGFDPMTGSRTDGVTGGTHPLSRRATRITSEADFVAAEAFIRRSSEYRFSRDAAFPLVGRGRPRFEVVLPIEDVFGPDYSNAVEGVRRLGSFNNPQGIVPIDFTGGQVKAVYELTPDGEPILVTLFPIGGT